MVDASSSYLHSDRPSLSANGFKAETRSVTAPLYQSLAAITGEDPPQSTQAPPIELKWLRSFPVSFERFSAVLAESVGENRCLLSPSTLDGSFGLPIP